MNAITVSTYAVVEVSKFLSRVIRSTHSVGSGTPVAVFEFASELLPHSEALKRARRLITGKDDALLDARDMREEIEESRSAGEDSNDE